MSSNVIRTDLLANYCRLQSSSDYQWQEWIQALCNDDLLLVRGCITQTFGRPEFDVANNNSSIFLLSYLSALEQEFCGWAIGSGEIIDYFLASKSANILDISTNWFWQKEHISAWMSSGRSAVTVPHGIRVAPFLSDSLSYFLDIILEPHINALIKSRNISDEQREYWIAQFEKFAVHSEDAVCGKLLAELKTLRSDNRDSKPIDFQLIISDISKVMDITHTYKVSDLVSYLNDLEELVSERIALGTIEFWRHLSSSMNEQDLIETLLKLHRNLLLYCGVDLVANSEMREPVALLNVLRFQLSSQEYQQHSLSIDRVEYGFKAQIDIGESNKSFMIYFQKEIESAISEFKRLERNRISERNNFDEIDHWRAPKR